MAATAFLMGFFTAFGWWSASKITTLIDKPSVKIEQVIKQEKKNDN